MRAIGTVALTIYFSALNASWFCSRRHSGLGGIE
jgi:hypothetical protein